MKLAGMNKRLGSKTPIFLSSIHREEFQMSEVDSDVLRNFYRKKHQTLGDLLTLNPEDGATIMSSVQKLVNFGFVKRDWEMEDRLKQDVIYAITKEGKELVIKEVEIDHNDT